MDEPLIEFHAHRPDVYPPPYPAARSVPEWLKQMPPDAGDVQGMTVPTVKRCPPFVEAMTCGYILPMPGEARFTRDAGGALRFDAEGKIIDAQPALQYAGSPFGGMVVVKFINPWIVRTPPGYSTLFLPLLNRFDFPFQVLAGVVETDTYYREVVIPAVCLMQPGTSVTLARGAPLVQLVPIRREGWRSTVGAWEVEGRNAAEAEV